MRLEGQDSFPDEAGKDIHLEMRKEKRSLLDCFKILLFLSSGDGYFGKILGSIQDVKDASRLKMEGGISPDAEAERNNLALKEFPGFSRVVGANLVFLS